MCARPDRSPRSGPGTWPRAADRTSGRNVLAIRALWLLLARARRRLPHPTYLLCHLLSGVITSSSVRSAALSRSAAALSIAPAGVSPIPSSVVNCAQTAAICGGARGSRTGRGLGRRDADPLVVASWRRRLSRWGDCSRSESAGSPQRCKRASGDSIFRPHSRLGAAWPRRPTAGCAYTARAAAQSSSGSE